VRQTGVDRLGIFTRLVVLDIASLDGRAIGLVVNSITQRHQEEHGRRDALLAVRQHILRRLPRTALFYNIDNVAKKCSVASPATFDSATFVMSPNSTRQVSTDHS